MPNVRLRLHDSRPEDNAEALLTGRLELAFIIRAAKTCPVRGLRFLELRREHIRLAVAPTHPFARRRAVSIAEVASEPFRCDSCPKNFRTITYSLMRFSLRQKANRGSRRSGTVWLALLPQWKRVSV